MFESWRKAEAAVPGQMEVDREASGKRRLDWWDLLAIGACSAVLLFISLGWAGSLGMEADEALFLTGARKIAFGAEEVLQLPWGFTVAGRPVQLMTMPYVGNLNALLYALSYKVFGVSLMASRGVNLFLGCCLLGLVYLVMHMQAGRWAAIAAMGLLLVDTELVLHTVTNSGPQLVQMLCGMGALLCLQRMAAGGGGMNLVGMAVLLGLGFNEKLTFVWVVVPFLLGVALLYRRDVWRAARWWHWLLGAVAGLAMLSPVLIFFWADPRLILAFGRAGGGVPQDFGGMLIWRWETLELMFASWWNMFYRAGAIDGLGSRSWAFFALFLAGVPLSIGSRNRFSLFCLGVGTGVFVFNLFSQDAGRVHHLLLMGPYWQCGMVTAAAGLQRSGLARAGRWALVAMLLVAGGESALAYRGYSNAVQSRQGVNHWSDMTTKAAQWLAGQWEAGQREADLAVVTTCWGVARPVEVLSGGYPVTEMFQNLVADPWTPGSEKEVEQWILREQTIWLVSDVTPVYTDIWRRISNKAAKLGLSPRQVAVFPSGGGEQRLYAYRMDRDGRAPAVMEWTEVPAAEAALRGVTVREDFGLLRVELRGKTSGPGEALTVKFMDAGGQVLYQYWRPFDWYPLQRESAVFYFGPRRWPRGFVRQEFHEGKPVRMVVQASLGRGQNMQVAVAH